MKLRFSLILSLIAWFGTSMEAQSQVITKYAGATVPAPGTLATNFAISPWAVVSDNLGGFYVAGGARVYHVDPGGVLRLIAGDRPPRRNSDGSPLIEGMGDGGPAAAAQLYGIFAIARDAPGNLYLADYASVRKIDTNGLIWTIAGNGTAGYGGDGGPAAGARVYPQGIALDRSGNIYILDGQFGPYWIRKITTDGKIDTIAGNTNAIRGNDDGQPALQVNLAYMNGIAIDDAGNLYVSDGTCRVRKITTDGIINTVAGQPMRPGNNTTCGYSGDGGPAIAATLDWPMALALGPDGSLYISDTRNNRVRRISPAGDISTVAGNGSQGFTGDGGPAIQAAIVPASGIAVDDSGSLYMAASNRIRKVTSDGVINSVAGTSSIGEGGPAVDAPLNLPGGLALDRTGNLYIAEVYGRRIRKVTRDGLIRMVAGGGTKSADNIPATEAYFRFPMGITMDGAGNLYIADYQDNKVRKIDVDGIVRTVAGTGAAGFSGDGGPATSARLSGPSTVRLDRAGNLYIADSANSRIRKVTPDGVITTVARIAEVADLAVSASGEIYTANYNFNRIYRLNSDGTITPVAGGQGPSTAGFGGDGGPATMALLNGPAGLALDASGNLYIADSGNNRIRRVNPEGVISTVAGTGIAGGAGDGGSPLEAQLRRPTFIAIDADGTFYVSDTDNGSVRKIAGLAPTPFIFAIPNGGGASLRTAGTALTTTTGYARVQTDPGHVNPRGLAIFGFRQGNVLVSEAAVPATLPIQNGRVFVQIDGRVNTGLAIANPNDRPATVNFLFANASGDVRSGSMTINASTQLATFLTEAPFGAPAQFNGTLTFTSSVPVGVIALRGLTNERNEFLMTTLPIVDLSRTPVTTTVTLSHFADGGGWTTQIALVNPSSTPTGGTVQFLDPSGNPAEVSVDGRTSNSWPYSIPGRASFGLITGGSGQIPRVGSVRIIPSGNTATPIALGVFSFRSGGVTVSEAAVSAVAGGSAFRIYAETSGSFEQNAAGSIETGVAISNLSNNTAIVSLEWLRLDGNPTGIEAMVNIPPNGQISRFLNQFSSQSPSPFEGIVRVSSSDSISVTGLRGRYNERGDLLITTLASLDEAGELIIGDLLIPHFADGGGYATQFILMNGSGSQASAGVLRFFSQAGIPTLLALH